MERQPVPGTNDPFVHLPDLRDKILAPAESGFRNLDLAVLDKKMREAGVNLKVASPAMVAEIKQRTSGLEGAWVAAAKKKGVDGAAFLAALRAEVKKVEAE